MEKKKTSKQTTTRHSHEGHRLIQQGLQDGLEFVDVNSGKVLVLEELDHLPEESDLVREENMRYLYSRDLPSCSVILDSNR